MKAFNEIKNNFIQQLRKSLLLKIFGAILALIVHIVPARLLNLEHYSIYSYCLSWFLILLLIAKLGIDISTVKYIASLKNDLLKGKIKGYIKESFATILISSFTVVIISLIILYLFQNKIQIMYFFTFLIFILIIPISSLQDCISGAFRGYNNIIYSELPESIIKPLLILILIFLFVYFKTSLNPTYFALIYFLSCFIVFLLSSIIFYRVNISKLRNVKSIKFKNLLKTSLPILFGAGLYLIIVQTDIIMLGLISDVNNVGLYVPAAKIASFVFFIVSIFTVFTSPLFSELYKNKNYNKLNKIIQMTTIWTSIIALLYLIIIIFFGKYLLLIYGPNFASSFLAMLILTMSYFFTTLTVAREFMIMTGFHNESAIIVFATLVFNILLNYILIYKYGINGAAIATAISLFLMNLCMTIIVYKKAKINTSIFSK